jgi:hypothetical protein
VWEKADIAGEIAQWCVNMICKDGTALLLVLVITSILTFFSFSCWHTSALFLDLVIAREQFYKHFYATEDILQDGIQVAKKNFSYYTKTPTIITRDTAYGIVSLYISRVETNNLLIRTVLEQENRALCVLHCNLTKDQRNENNTQYMVQHFTIGNIV